MKLQPAQPLLLTQRGCPLRFDLIDADNPSGGIIGRATYQSWATARGLITYTVQVRSEGKLLTGQLHVQARALF